MKRIQLKDRLLPTYTHGEEQFHLVSHIVGGGVGVIALVVCVLMSALKGDIYGVVGSAIYGASLIAFYVL